ncbi:hypothetical protein WOLCODRAFT_149131 [Wolfiporia cocos MD-104 SS10]|uniref:Uncharacterized protein n=1 Tax=Wolfiporia cocos (strain MD-104) TaxID=742152 RepID=A0A2H3J7I8_WOLCO|nr:hypothetical protein WOLCODRAFT_149131 [Wolfiporia cocos MD-104 SS10]
MRKGLSLQDKDALEKHITNVAERWEDAERYEGHWPIHIMTRHVLTKSSSVHNTAKMDTKHGTGRALPSGSKRNVKQPMAGTPHRVHSLLSSPTKHTRNTVRERVRNDLSDNEQRASLRTHSEAEPITTFLRSLRLPLEHLLPMFKAIGIRDDKTLATLAIIPDNEKWLLRNLRATAFEVKLIIDGLKERENAKQEDLET